MEERSRANKTIQRPPFRSAPALSLPGPKATAIRDNPTTLPSSDDRPRAESSTAQLASDHTRSTFNVQRLVPRLGTRTRIDTPFNRYA